MEHERVPLVEEQRRRHGDRHPRPEVPRGGRPADDGARVDERHDRLREPPVRDVEETACEERRDRSPEQERPRKERVVVEELHVREEVLVQVATRLEWPGERADGVRHEGQREEERGPAPSGCEPLEPGADRGERRAGFRHEVGVRHGR